MSRSIRWCHDKSQESELPQACIEPSRCTDLRLRAICEKRVPVLVPARGEVDSAVINFDLNTWQPQIVSVSSVR